MTWATISGPGTTTATKFHGDVMNKINNMFGGVDVTDSVSIHASVGWTIPTLTADITGDLGLPQSIVTISTGVAATAGETSMAVAAESGTTDTIDSLTGSANDDIKFLYADAGDTITLTHNGSASADEFILLEAANKTLSETIPTIVVRRGTIWYEWGGGAGSTSFIGFTGDADLDMGSFDVDVSTDATKGLILRDTQTTPHKWRLTITNDGNLESEDLGAA